MALVFGVPSAIPGDIPSSRSRISHKWTDWTGAEWDLTAHDGTSGVVLLHDGITGLHMPEFERYTDALATRHGQVLRGHQVKPRDVVWPLFLYEDTTSEAWTQYDALFWRGMHPMRPGTWTVEAPGSEARSLTCTFASSDPAFARDPAYAQWAIYAVQLVADDPFWHGPEVMPQFRDQQPVNWLGGGPVDQPGAATPFVISPNSTASTANVSNNGDLEAWIAWEAIGPIDAGLRLGVGDRTITIGAAIPAGSRLILDTDPSSQQPLINGAEYEPIVRPSYAPIPTGGRTDLVVDMHGAGAVVAKLTPRYYRAW